MTRCRPRLCARRCSTIAGTFYRRGIIETWGRGTLKIARLMRETGHEPPPVSVREGAVVFIFGLPVETPGKTPGKTPGMILGLLRAEPGLSVPELAARVGPDKGGHWQVIE